MKNTTSINEEKIQMVKDLLKNAIDAMNKSYDEAMDKIEKEWMNERIRKEKA